MYKTILNDILLQSCQIYANIFKWITSGNIKKNDLDTNMSQLIILITSSKDN